MRKVTIVAEFIDKLSGNVKKADAELAHFSKTAEVTQTSTSKLSGTVKKLAGVFVGLFAVHKVVETFRRAIEVATEYDDALMRLQAVYQSTGGVVGKTVSELEKFAGQMQQLTVYSDDAVLSAESMMLTFKSIKGDVFQDAVKAALDLATVFNQDVKSAVLQIGKALEDPRIGLTALRRVGVSFSEDQTELIKKLVEEGRLYEAQVMILKEIQSQVGGASAALTNTYGGALKQIKNAWEDVLKQIGFSLTKNQALIESMHKIRDALEEIAGKISENRTGMMQLSNVAADFLATIAEGAPDVISGVTEVLRGVWTGFKLVGTGISTLVFTVINGVEAVVSGAGAAISWLLDRTIGTAVRAIGEIGDKVQQIQSALGASVIGIDLSGLKEFRISITTEGFEEAKKKIDAIKGAFDSIVNDDLGVFDAYLGGIAQGTGEVATGWQGVREAVQSANEAMKETAETVSDVADKSSDAMMELGIEFKESMAAIQDYIAELANGMAIEINTATDQADSSFQDFGLNVKDISQRVISTSLDRAFGAIESAIKGAKVDWDEFVKDFMIDIAAMIAKALVFQAVMSALSIGTGMPFAGVFSMPSTTPGVAIPQANVEGNVIVTPPNIMVEVHNATPDTYVRVFSQMPIKERIQIKRSLEEV